MSDEAVQSSEPTVDEMFAATEEGATPPVEETTPAAESKADAEQMFEYQALGQTRKEPLSLILKRASQGYDYATKQDELKQQNASAESRLAEANTLHEKYAQIDEYARENPEWYDHWSQAYENRQTDPNQQGQQPQVDFSPVMEKITALENDFKGVQEHVTQQKQSTEDSKYWDEMKAINKEFPDVDFSQSDESGKTLEYKILQHAQELGIGSFRVAFRDFYHDNLKTRMNEQAKQDIIAKDKENRKKGIVSTSNTPMLNTDMPDLRNMSESEILDAAIADFESSD